MKRMVKRAAKRVAKGATPRMAELALGRKGRMAMNAGRWAARYVVRRKKSSIKRAALAGIGGLAVAIPLGMWLGRRMMEGSARQT